jgi:hypothetical protein
MVIFLSVWVEGILRLFANFYLHRKFSIFLRNDRDCKAVALKEYYDYSPISTCTEGLNIFEKQ